MCVCVCLSVCLSVCLYCVCVWVLFCIRGCVLYTVRIEKVGVVLVGVCMGIFFIEGRGDALLLCVGW